MQLSNFKTMGILTYQLYKLNFPQFHRVFCSSYISLMPLLKLCIFLFFFFINKFGFFLSIRVVIIIFGGCGCFLVCIEFAMYLDLSLFLLFWGFVK